ncbi:MAG: hypothetical protein ACK5KM_05165 [Hyphomicrobiaceae bacterium]
MSGFSGRPSFYSAASPSALPSDSACSPPDDPSQERDGAARQADVAASSVYSPHFASSDGTVAPFKPTAELTNLLDGIPPAVKNKFTYNHLAALEVALVKSRPVSRKHPLDYRVSLPFFGKRYYFVFLGGTERRNKKRIERDGQNAPWRLTTAYFIIVTLLVSVGLSALILGLYALKSLMGIDLFEGHSFMHGIIYSK